MLKPVVARNVSLYAESLRVNAGVAAAAFFLSPSARLALEYKNTPLKAKAVPAILSGETGFLKYSSVTTMTVTRFMQLPTECVTGLTRERIMYEICWYIWKQKPAIIKLLANSWTLTPTALIVEG